MNLTVMVASASLLVSAIVALIQIVKHWTEAREQRIEQASGVVRAKAERDAIAVKSAEGALMVMERMLTITKTSEQEMRVRLDAMRERVSSLERQLAEAQTFMRERVGELEGKLAAANAHIEDLQHRLSSS